MKTPFIAAAALTIAFLPVTAAAAGTVPVVEKKLVAELPAPFGAGIPAPEDFKVFQCVDRVYLVLQEQKDGGYKGQKVSRLFAMKTDGSQLTSYWQVMAEDTTSSVVRFTGTCVGDRAVIVNHWEDNQHQTAGDMATSVNGEETFGPLWTPDGRTIYHWYKTDAGPLGLDGRFKTHALHVRRDATAIEGSVVQTAAGVAGSSVNFVLGGDGRAHVLHAPWYLDLQANPVTSGVRRLTFARTANRTIVPGWTVVRQDFALASDSTPATVVNAARADFRDLEWSASPSGRDTYLRLEEKASDLAFANDGMHLRPLAWNDATSTFEPTGADILVQAAPVVPGTPRIYAAERYRTNPGTSFAYAMRAGDGKLQVWKATVK